MKGLNKRDRAMVAKRRMLFLFIHVMVYLGVFLLLIGITSYFMADRIYVDADEGILELATKLSEKPPFLSLGEEELAYKYFIVYYDSDNRILNDVGYAAAIRDELINTEGVWKTEECYTIRLYESYFRVYVLPMDLGGASYVKVLLNVDMLQYVRTEALKNVTIWFSVVLIFIAVVSFGVSKLQTAPLAKMLTKKESFTADVSHEIGTPLAVIQGNLQDILSSSSKLEPNVVDKISISLTEVQRLKKMSKELLTLTRADTDNLQIVYKKCDLKNLFEEITEPYKLLAETQNKSVELSVIKLSENFYADEDKLKQVLISLLDNATKNTKDGDSIFVNLRYDNKKLNLIVSDTGIGVDEAELEYVFQRFYRSSRSRALNHEGTGLGLAIVHSIIIGMEGKIVASNNNPHGFVLDIIIPNHYPKGGTSAKK